MDPVDDVFRAEDWWLFHDLLSGTREQRVDLERGVSPAAQKARRSSDRVAAVVDAGGVQALELIAKLLDAAPTQDAVNLVGAGPLENLVHAHGAQLLDEIERHARQEPAFAEALRSVWLDQGDLPAEVESRLGKWIRVSGIN